MADAPAAVAAAAAQLADMTGCSAAEASFFAEATNGDLSAAANMYYGARDAQRAYAPRRAAPPSRARRA
jgi:hypothetical protein